MSDPVRSLKRILGDQLSPDAKEIYHQETLKLQQDRLAIGRSALRVGWIIGAVGTTIGVAGMICAATLFPLKTVQVEYFQVNQSTGFVGPSMGASDAPKLFNAQVTQAALQTYVEQREGYLYQTDPVAFHRVSIMSTADEQARYKVAHDSPTAPSRVLRDHGYVQIDNLQFFPIGEGRSETKQYVVKFDRRVMRAGDPVPSRGEPCTAEISFQFHPEYPMALPDRRVNPWGLQVLDYAAHSDDPRQK